MRNSGDSQDSHELSNDPKKRPGSDTKSQDEKLNKLEGLMGNFDVDQAKEWIDTRRRHRISLIILLAIFVFLVILKIISGLMICNWATSINTPCGTTFVADICFSVLLVIAAVPILVGVLLKLPKIVTSSLIGLFSIVVMVNLASHLLYLPFVWKRHSTYMAKVQCANNLTINEPWLLDDLETSYSSTELAGIASSIIIHLLIAIASLAMLCVHSPFDLLENYGSRNEMRRVDKRTIRFEKCNLQGLGSLIVFTGSNFMVIFCLAEDFTAVNLLNGMRSDEFSELDVVTGIELAIAFLITVLVYTLYICALLRPSLKLGYVALVSEIFILIIFMGVAYVATFCVCFEFTQTMYRVENLVCEKGAITLLDGPPKMMLAGIVYHFILMVIIIYAIGFSISNMPNFISYLVLCKYEDDVNKEIQKSDPESKTKVKRDSTTTRSS